MKGKFWHFLKLLCTRIIGYRKVILEVKIIDIQISNTDLNTDTLVFEYRNGKRSKISISPLLSVELENYIGKTVKARCEKYLIFRKVFFIDVKAFLLNGTWKSIFHNENRFDLIEETTLMVIHLRNPKNLLLGVYDCERKKTIATFTSADEVFDAMHCSEKTLKRFILSGEKFPACVKYYGDNSKITITLKHKRMAQCQ